MDFHFAFKTTFFLLSQKLLKSFCAQCDLLLMLVQYYIRHKLFEIHISIF